MVSSSYEEDCISQILDIKSREYYVGLFREEGLIINGEWIICIIKNEYNGLTRLDYNIKTKKFKMSKKDNRELDFITIPISDIHSKSIIDVSNDGMRIEGSLLKDSPFGPVCLMNESNQLIYRGVMIGDKKECFGVEFYPDLGQIEYIGCYWNNDRHGFGMLYDRKGNLVYEGDWLCGSKEYERSVILKDIDNDSSRSGSSDEDIEDDGDSSGSGSSDDEDIEEDDGMSNNDSSNGSDDEGSVILKDIDNNRMVHSLIHELIIDEEVGNDYEVDLLLCGFDYLERVVVKKNSFQNLNCLKISDNSVLKSIEIEDGEWDEGAFASVETAILASDFVTH